MAHQRGSLRREGAQWVLRFKQSQGERTVYRAVRVGPGSELRTRAAARAMADRIMATQVGAAIAGQRLKFGDYLPAWRASHMDGIVRASTAKCWASTLRLHLLPAFGAWDLVDIDVQAAQAFVASLGRKGLGTARSQNVTSLLRQILRQAGKDGYAVQTIGPFTLKFPKDGRRHQERRCFTPEETRTILAAAALPLRALYGVLAYTGMRCGEALGLQWVHVNFPGEVIHIRQAAVDGRIYLPKTAGSVADVPLPPPLVAILQDYARWQDEHAGHIAERAGCLLFAGPKGGPLSAGGIRQHHFSPLLERLRIPHGGLHAFRHGLTTLMLQEGTDVKTVREVLRHANLRNIMTYTHTNVAHTSAAMARAAATIAGPTP